MPAWPVVRFGQRDFSGADDDSDPGQVGLPADMLPAVTQSMSAKIPLARYGTAREIANAALFLGSPADSFITGAEVAVDGGLLVA
jgi:NAD(P)-dependent dehydrogenase (short-subunit alcohol dehydrogenase family)